MAPLKEDIRRAMGDGILPIVAEPVVFTIATHDEELAMAVGLARSLRLIGDSTRRVLIAHRNPDLDRTGFAQVLPLSADPFAAIFAATDAVSALKLPPSSLAFRRLDPIFACAASEPVRYGPLELRSRDARGEPRELDADLDFLCGPHGLVGSLNLDVGRGECDFVFRRGDRIRQVAPILFHAGEEDYSVAYVRQLEALERLARFEDRHGYGYIGFWRKLKKSAERRYLKHVAHKL